MKQQLGCLGIGFDWEREIATHTPEYYRWTQLIFLRLLEKGLAYRAEAEVNWDPVDKTVLANEQVDSLGRSWRSGAVVEKRMLPQWFFRITRYAEELQNSLAGLEWVERVKSMQQGWIGFRKGYSIEMEISSLCADGLGELTEK
jgi:leucyl-tRNA synthetase